MPRICAIGEAMGELRPDTGDRYRMGFAGDVFNTLAYIKMLGGAGWQAGFVSAIGDDPLSGQFVLRCQELGIDDHCTRVTGGSIGLYLIQTDERGERSFSYWRSASPARSAINHLDAHQHRALVNCDYILVSGISLAILDEPQRETLATLLTGVQPSTRIVFDPNYRARLWESVDAARHWISRFYELSDIALPGLDEERTLFGHDSAQAVLARTELTNNLDVVVKDGTNGAYGRSGGVEFYAPAAPVNTVVDTTSAGDAFNAAWLVARAAGQTADQAGAFAAAVAGVVVSHPGAIIAQHALSHLINPD